MPKLRNFVVYSSVKLLIDAAIYYFWQALLSILFHCIKMAFYSHSIFFIFCEAHYSVALIFVMWLKKLCCL